ncbi:helix-turn-helix transcriptional regulator [Flavobacterium zhairuonense]|uniref:helix-turn-helix transcriptional regulator n=1 Tax=Flavobacterium zhairuonense TaxID=2493631 RepID=UPI001049AC3F|nr:helix-turn-helix transcriptional regulator [Flavobacterium zhairuonense]KAF2512108.1 helix-turn-helix transcriptional regulator [Flavobacterium zhairuonense]
MEKNDSKSRKLIFDEEGLQSLAKRLKEVRSEKKMSQEDLADKSDITLSQIARIETAKINPTVSTIFKIARGLEVSPKELFDFELVAIKKK